MFYHVVLVCSVVCYYAPYNYKHRYRAVQFKLSCLRSTHRVGPGVAVSTLIVLVPFGTPPVTGSPYSPSFYLEGR